MAKQEVADQELEQEPAQDSAAAEAIRRKELINVGGMASVFSEGASINGRVIFPDASNDQLGLKNAHIYRHPKLGDFVAFAVDYQDLGGHKLERQGWELDPHLRPAEPLRVALDGTILWFDEEAEDEQPPKVMGNSRELELVAPAPVCFQCENVHPEGPELAHRERREELQRKLDAMLGKGWDEDLDDEEVEEREVRERVCAHCHEGYDPHGRDANRHQAIADFQIMTMARDRKPRWDAGYAQIEGLARTQMKDWPNGNLFPGPAKETLRESGQASRQEFWAKQLHGALDDVQRAWFKRSVHFMKILAVRDADLLITGGYTTDCTEAKRGEPSGKYSVRILEMSGVSRTVGFDD